MSFHAVLHFDDLVYFRDCSLHGAVLSCLTGCNAAPGVRLTGGLRLTGGVYLIGVLAYSHCPDIHLMLLYQNSGAV